MLIQNNIYCWIETTTWIKISESPEYKFYDNIGDLSIRYFLYHSNDTKRNPWVMLCSNNPINDSSTITDYRLPCSYVTKSEKVHISSHGGLKKLHNANFA